MRLAVGDAVVYPAHGTGRVAARELRVVLGAEQEVVVLDLEEGLSITLTLEQARTRLRPVASKADLQRVQQTLREEGDASEATWQARLRKQQSRLASGDLVALAEIVRDGIRRQSEQGTQPKLSAGERKLYLQARHLLAQEIGAARGLEPAEADIWIETQAASP